MRNRIKLFALSCAVIWALAGCSFGNSYLTDSKIDQVRSDKLTSYPITVAVLPFTHPNKSNNIAAFEKQYFPIKLVSLLKSSPVIRNAYYSSSETPSTNYYIKGVINLSDGENTEIQLRMFSSDHKEVLSYSFGYANSLDDFSKSQLDRLWYRAVNKINSTILGLNVPDKALLSKQILGYTGQQPTPEAMNENIRRILYDASDFENEKLLQPFTTGLAKKLSLIEPRYVKWQEESTSHAIRKRSAENRETFNMFFALLAAAASGAAQGSGNYEDASTLEQQSYQLMDMALEAGEEASSYESMISDVESVIDDNIEGEQVSINNVSVTLSGSFDERISRIRGAVKEILVKEGAVAAAAE